VGLIAFFGGLAIIFSVGELQRHSREDSAQAAIRPAAPLILERTSVDS
jgi:hypothetical protein